jgi:glycogen debranching enzyme
MDTQATPRDGAAVEVVGLLASALRFLAKSHERGLFQYRGVARPGGFVTWREWHELLIASFEGWFYVPRRTEHDTQYFIERGLASVRGIYKDTVGSVGEVGDYEFRPNVVVAMTVAPELFDPVHAVACLDLIEERLLGPIGMKTLDSADPRYRGVYAEGESRDKLASCGYNRHNGPEWVWLTGYFFRATIRFKKKMSEKMLQVLGSLKRALRESEAFGLPNFTNRDGEFCSDACMSHSCSVGCVMDLVYDCFQYPEDELIDWGVEDGME